MRSEAELREASGYASRPRDFDDLIGILDPELRLITPTDPEGSAGETQSGDPPAQPALLSAHPRLPRPLAPRLADRKQRETRRGRAELRLAERAAIWDAKPENRHLPSVSEWASIRTLTRPKDWTEPQRRMMRRAGRCMVCRRSGMAALIALLSWGGIELYGTFRASGLVESLGTANISEVPAIVSRIAGYRRWVDPRLRSLLQNPESSSREKLNASLALLPVDRSQLPFLAERLLGASPSELPVLRDVLSPHRGELIPKLWTVLEAAKTSDDRMLCGAGALARYDPANPEWQTIAHRLAPAIVAVNPVYLGSWLDALRPVKRPLIDPLVTIFRDKARPETEHILATSILAEYGSDDPELLAELLMIADPQSYNTLFAVAVRQPQKMMPLFQAELAQTASTSTDATQAEAAKETLAERQARAAVALIRMGKANDVWPLLGHSPDPRVRSFIVNLVKPLLTDPVEIAQELERLNSLANRQPPVANPKMHDILFDSDTSTRRALILALGTFGADDLSPAEREKLANMLVDLYHNDPDSGVHGAAQWALRQWKEHEKLKTKDAGSIPLEERGPRRWFVNSQGQTLAIIAGPLEFQMGSAETDPERNAAIEREYQVTIPRKFAIATNEVTFGQFQRQSRPTLASNWTRTPRNN